MSKVKELQYNNEKFIEAVSQVRRALYASDHKGSILLRCLLLSPEQDNGINEQNFNELIEKFSLFRADQLVLARDVVNNMRYIREIVLSNDSARELLNGIIDKISDEAAERMAIHEFVGRREIDSS